MNSNIIVMLTIAIFISAIFFAFFSDETDEDLVINTLIFFGISSTSILIGVKLPEIIHLIKGY
jgi:hypothetical protein